jgi:hypothetical protein
MGGPGPRGDLGRLQKVQSAMGFLSVSATQPRVGHPDRGRGDEEPRDYTTSCAARCGPLVLLLY